MEPHAPHPTLLSGLMRQHEQLQQQKELDTRCTHTLGGFSNATTLSTMPELSLY